MTWLRRLPARLLYLFVFLMPWQTRWFLRLGKLNGGEWEFGTVSLYATDIIFLLALLSFLLFLWRKKSERPKPSRLDVALAAFLVLAALSYFWAVDKSVVLYNILKLAEGLLLVWLIGQQYVSIRPLARWFVAGAATQAGLGMFQVLTQQSWAVSWLGLAIHDPAQLGTSVVQTDSLRYLRAYAALPHPNILGGYLAVAVLAVCGLYADLYRRAYAWWKQRHDRRVERKHLALFGLELAGYITALIMCTAGLLLSFSRSAWLGALVGVAIIVYWLIRYFALRRSAVWAKILIIIALTVGVTAVILPGFWPARFDASQRLEQKSITDRVTEWEQARALFSRYWLTGAGLGNYTAGLHETFPNLKPWEYQPVHFVPAIVAVELGALGFFVYVLFIVELIRRLLRAITRPHPDSWPPVAAAALAVLLVITLFDHYLWSLSFGILLWWLVVGMVRRTT